MCIRDRTYIDNWKYSFAGYEISDAQIHENEIKEAEKKVAALLNYVVPEINENQNLDNQIEEQMCIRDRVQLMITMI